MNTRKKLLNKIQSTTSTVAGMGLAAVIGGSFAMFISESSERPTGWTQCFDTIEAAIAVGDDANEALDTIRADRESNDRQLQAHQRALDQLRADLRWGDPDQRQWLEVATEQTREQIETLRDAEEMAGDTEGCLEQF